MNINVTVQLAEGDNMQETSDEIADGVLKALGGDEKKDFVTVNIMQPIVVHTAGNQPMPVPPPPPPPESSEET